MASLERSVDDDREEARLRALERYEVTDTPPEEAFDRIARVAAQLAGCPIAMVNIIDRRRQWSKAQVGLSIPEMPRFEAFCAEAVERGDTLVVEDARRDPRFADCPLVTSAVRVQFYAGVPIRSREGFALGTLCVMDHVPKRLSSSQYEALHALAVEVEQQLELRRALREARHLQGQRQELIALVVHDLRNPLQAIMASSHFALGQRELQSGSFRALEDVLTLGHQLVGLARNLLDMTRAEVGRLEPVRHAVDLEPLLRAVEAEARRVGLVSGRRVRTQWRLERQTVHIDGDLLRRVVESLLLNALAYAPVDTDVLLAVSVGAKGPLSVQVDDAGPRVPAAGRELVFRLQPTATERHGRVGQGSCLIFSRLAVEAMGGRVWVEDGPVGASFRFEIPL